MSRAPRRCFPLVSMSFFWLAAGAFGAPAAPASALGGYGLGSAGAAARHNLLLVTLDTTRADHLGCYGARDAQTPNLDALASSGLRFTHAVSSVPVTLPAHSTLMTGLYPPRHGVRNNSEYVLADRHATLAERLQAAGYDTAAFVSAFVLDARFGLNQGFQLYDDRVEAARGSTFATGNNERTASEVTDVALAWLGRGRTQPFFAWVHYYDPHASYRPPAPHAERFAARPYDGEIAFMDAQLGRLLERLTALGLRERTLVVVVADHGESLGEHGESTHGIFLYEAVMRVPLIVAHPRAVPRPGVVDGLVSLADLAPTLLDLLGLPLPAEIDGQSLVRLKPDRRRAVYMESLLPYLDYGWAPLFALRRPGDKYILAPRPEYYDLTVDPRETRDLHAGAKGDTRAAVERLSTALRAALEQQPAPAPGAAQEAEVAERLRALGYVGGAGPAAPLPKPGDARAGAALADPKDNIGVAVDLVEANGRLLAGRPQDALKLVLDARRRSPQDRSVLQVLGKIYIRLGRLKEAEEALRAFTDIRPKADVSLLLAQILILDGRHAEAGALLDSAEQLDPLHGGVLIARGDLLARTGRRAEAEAAYSQAIKVDPYRAAGAAQARLAKLRAGQTP